MLANFTDREPCRRKTRRPPIDAALAEAERIRRSRIHLDGERDVVDLSAYAAAILDRLLHRGIVVAIDGPSYRMRAHRQRSEQLRNAINHKENQ